MELLNKLKGADIHERLEYISFDAYIKKVCEEPQITRNAFQRFHDMIMYYGTVSYERYGRKTIRYNFLDDPFKCGKAIYGVDWNFMHLMRIVKSAARGYGHEKRIILLLGPPGSTKSSAVDLFKIGLEDYSKKDEGKLYHLVWYAKKDADPAVRRAIGLLNPQDEYLDCEMHDEPLNLLRLLYEDDIVTTDPVKEINKMTPSDAEYQARAWRMPCPKCDTPFYDLLRIYDGDWAKVLTDHVRVKRMYISDKRRIGIGTIQPKSEKDQDATEFTGDTNYQAVAVYGKESDPRSFTYEGEFQVGNRGMTELIEVYKLDVAFLYDLLEASQSHRIKPRKQRQLDIDEIIITHTNPHEWENKIKKNPEMDALRDRTTKVNFPYVIRLEDELKIYERDYNDRSIARVHLAPHTLEMAATWSTLTHIEEPAEHANLSRMQKLHLYNGRQLTHHSPEKTKELIQESPNEGMSGISPRFIQDMISNALVDLEVEEICLNPFILMQTIKNGLIEGHHTVAEEKDKKAEFLKLLEHTKEEFDLIIDNEIQNAISTDKKALQNLCAQYIKNVDAAVHERKILDSFSKVEQEPDEGFMRKIETADPEDVVSEEGKEQWRSVILNHIANLSLKEEKFTFDSNERLHKKLRLHLSRVTKEWLKLERIVDAVAVDKDTEKKIDELKSRLVKEYGYCAVCAEGIMHYVGQMRSKDATMEKEEES